MCLRRLRRRTASAGGTPPSSPPTPWWAGMRGRVGGQPRCPPHRSGSPLRAVPPQRADRCHGKELGGCATAAAGGSTPRSRQHRRHGPRGRPQSRRGGPRVRAPRHRRPDPPPAPRSIPTESRPRRLWHRAVTCCAGSGVTRIKPTVTESTSASPPAGMPSSRHRPTSGLGSPAPSHRPQADARADRSHRTLLEHGPTPESRPARGRGRTKRRPALPYVVRTGVPPVIHAAHLGPVAAISAYP